MEGLEGGQVLSINLLRNSWAKFAQNNAFLFFVLGSVFDERKHFHKTLSQENNI